jgi:DNA-binding CsgD family transcriptional regulator
MRRWRGSLGATPLESASEGIGKLTARDIEIVEAVVAGYSDREIASQLSTTEVSVEHQLSVIFDRLKVSGRLELALSTIERGLIRTCWFIVTGNQPGFCWGGRKSFFLRLNPTFRRSTPKPQTVLGNRRSPRLDSQALIRYRYQETQGAISLSAAVP